MVCGEWEGAWGGGWHVSLCKSKITQKSKNNNKNWRIWVSIPVHSPCTAGALLSPHNTLWYYKQIWFWNIRVPLYKARNNKNKKAGESGYRSQYLLHAKQTLLYKAKKKKKQQKLENLGIDPSTSCMLSRRSTIWANSPHSTIWHYKQIWFSTLYQWYIRIWYRIIKLFYYFSIFFAI